MGDIDTTAISGVEARGYRRGAVSTDSWDQYVIPIRDRISSFFGRACTFKTPGRAATTQKILALHNATSSSVIVCVNRVTVDLLSTVTKAITVVPPVVRVHRFTAVPTNGTVLAKVALDTSQSSNASVTAWGDASGDGTGSGTTLTVTVPASSMLAQQYAPRLFGTAPIGYEPVDTLQFFYGEPDITLRALEGVVVYLDAAVVTTGNPATDMWTATIDWEEYTRP